MYPGFQKVVIQSGVILDLIQYILLCGKDSVARGTGCGRRRWLENDRQGARGKKSRNHEGDTRLSPSWGILVINGRGEGYTGKDPRRRGERG